MSNSQSEPTCLVVSALSTDFIWRAGDAIALYAKRGWKIKVVCLSFGEKGESQKLWKDLADKKRATLAGGEPGLEIESLRRGLLEHGLTYYNHHQNAQE